MTVEVSTGTSLADEPRTLHPTPQLLELVLARTEKIDESTRVLLLVLMIAQHAGRSKPSICIRSGRAWARKPQYGIAIMS